MKAQTGDTAILVMLVTSGLSHLPPMKVVTILSGVVSFDLKWFIVSAIVARGGRFYLLAYLLQRYGVQVTELYRAADGADGGGAWWWRAG